MQEPICNFHQNMVICETSNRQSIWDAFGFFGGGSTGKSALSFILGRLLVERDGFLVNNGRGLKIIDDNFTLENGLVSSDDWGGKDKLGKRCAFIECLNKLGYSDKKVDTQVRPQHQAFKLNTFIGWLMFFDDLPTPKIVKTNRDEFVNKLLCSNPCHGKTPDHPTSPSQDEICASPQIRDRIRESFARSWKYWTVTRRNTKGAQDGPVLENLALKAYDLWQPILSRNATQPRGFEK
jgi:hypothetical protein